MIRFIRLLICLPICLSLAHAQQNPLESIKGCTFVPTEWADGDSFQIKKPDGILMTIRIYTVDCVELHINSDSDKSRLRDQRRYFGITEVKGTAPNSVELAKSFAKKAAEFSSTKLRQPFTIHTRMSKAPGDGKHERFYAFVESSDGKDLATELIRNGLARARKIATDGPEERTAERYRQNLADLELQSAKRGNGIWKFTDWDKLPEERNAQLIADEEDQIAQGNPLPADFRLNPNTASREDLDRLPGIGPALAESIAAAREEEPFEKPDDLMRVPGIKRKTLDKIRPFIEFKGE